ncbi:MAG TPA: hypothetical protein DCL40_00990, partial [Coxiellaceae bacterium]|nr:hypothetical protein [Coxiellaceae bacterium]
MVKRLLASEYHRLFYSSWQLGNNNTVSIAFDIEGPLNCEILSQIIDKLVIEQPFLRTTFTEINGTLYQDIHEQGNTQLDIIPLNKTKQSINTVVNEYYQQPFDLHTLPLAKFYLLRLPSNRFKFILLNSHIIADSVVAHFLVQYIEQTYNAMALGNEPPTFTTSSMNQYIEHETNTLTQQKKNIDIAFWKIIFSNDQYSLNWCGRPSPSQSNNHEKNTVYFSISEQQSNQLITHATTLNTTPFILISSLFAYLLSRYTHSNHFYLSYPINMRPKAFRNLLGSLINTSVLAIDIDHSLTLAEWIATVQRFRQASKPHTHLPYPDLYRLFQQTNQQTPSPLTQAAIIPGADLSAVAPSLYQCSTVGAPLNLNMPYAVALSYQHDDVFTFRFEDPAGHLTEQQRKLFCDHWLNLLQKSMDDPHCRLQDIALSSGKKTHHHIQQDIPKQTNSDALNQTLDSAFIKIAKHFPHHIAITNTEITYQALLDRMAQWTHTIHHMLPKLPNNHPPIVGLCCSRTPHMIELQLALLHCGYIVMPLNPDDPSQRLEKIMQHSQSITLIYDSKVIHQHNHVISSGQWKTLQIDSEAISTLTSRQPTQLPKPSRQSSAAYLMHTSGSTGQPKGIMISHASLIALQQSMQKEYPTDHQDTWSCFHSLAFDVSLFEIWGALLTGARLMIASEHARTDMHEFHQNLIDHKVSVLSQTPRVFELLIDYDIQINKRAPSLRWIFLAGDRVDLTPIERWWSSFTEPHPSIINLYGTTETTIHATHQQLSPNCKLDQQGLIGKPLDHLIAVVLDNAGQMAEPGMMGEIGLAGKHCAQRYWNHDEISKKSFSSSIDLSIFGLPKATRLYRTGDLGYWDDHYQLNYIGRHDHQIKRHGYRMELGEIEQAMQLHPDALRVAITLEQYGTTDKLIAWFQTTSG